MNQNLEIDSSIVFSDTAFVFCEYGSVESFSNFHDYSHPVAGSETDVFGRTRTNQILDTIPTQTKLNMIQEHKEHIKRETQEASGYKSLLGEPSIDLPESNNIVDMWKDLYESYTNADNE